jgi:hypothetical protein
MRPISELINEAESAWSMVQETAAKVPGRCIIHPPSPAAADELHRTQVTTRSPMGAIVYHSGGIAVEDGWLRILGSGSPAIPRSLPGWNEGRSHGFYLVADDVAGGFFAINGGGLMGEKGEICYFSPRTLKWAPLGANYTQFLTWACTDFGSFYDDLRHPQWREALAKLGPDRCFFFYPPLWAKECSLETCYKGDIPVTEAYSFQTDTARQMNGGAAPDSPAGTKTPTSGPFAPKTFLGKTLFAAYKKLRGK